MEILEKHQQHLSLLVHEKDHGIYDAMNKGLKLARGTYTLFLNADDQFANAKVLEQLSKYTQSNSAILGRVRIFKANKLYRVYSAKHFKPWMFIFGHQPPHPGFVCKTELLRSAGGFDASYKISGDFELMLKLFNTKNFSWHAIPLTITHMQHGGASSGSFSKKAAINKENYKALKQNNKLAFGPFIWMKYALKIFQIRW
jgi:glycosyltransferase involved in cell wall biosynthesis